MSFKAALGGMTALPQWFVWRLEWDAEEGKYEKHPCPLSGEDKWCGAGDTTNHTTFDNAVTALQSLWLNNPPYQAMTYALGFYMSPGCGYWFLDIDKAVDETGQVRPFAQSLVDTYPGAFVEYSSSRKGLHIIGKGHVTPGHRNKPEARTVGAALKPIELEFYVQERGIAFGLDLAASGCADNTFAIQPLLDAYFPPRPQGTVAARADWRGPADDEVLIERMLRARQSAAVAFGGKVSLPQLWRGEAERNNENDMALASHLAFWTGCDEERIERLMLRTPMRREKWYSRRKDQTYLTFTISRACASCTAVYQEAQPNMAVVQGLYAVGGDDDAADDSAPLARITEVQTEVVSQEVWDRVEATLQLIESCETEFDLHNTIIPKVRATAIPAAFHEKIVAPVQRKLSLWGNKMKVSQVRALLFPPTLRGAKGVVQLPEWAAPWCFIGTDDKFFNTNTAQSRSLFGFNAEFGREMPINDQGRRDNAAEQCLHFWNMPVVDRTGYRPDQGPFYEWEGARYANKYSVTSFPTPATQYTADGVAGIEAFQALLMDICGRRQRVFETLLYWYAHNCQYPGIKIRWAPLVKGIHGDGKTLCTMVLHSAMGSRNVGLTENSSLTNTGGFTDWADGFAVNFIEEIYLTGKARYMLYNAMKGYIANNIVSVNGKGIKHYKFWNCTNHYATTNQNDGVPLEPTDRRWFVIFTPWQSKADMYAYCGLEDDAAWRRRTDAIDRACKTCAGELRAWLLSLPIPSWFDKDADAMITPEKLQMMASSTEDAESVALQIIEDGSVGITREVLSSARLSAMLTHRASMDGFDVPKSTALNHMLNRLGYSKFPDIVKWNGQTHTIWLRNGITLDADGIREKLAGSGSGPTLNLPGATLNPTLNLLPPPNFPRPT